MASYAEAVSRRIVPQVWRYGVRGTFAGLGVVLLPLRALHLALERSSLLPRPCSQPCSGPPCPVLPCRFFSCVVWCMSECVAETTTSVGRSSAASDLCRRCPFLRLPRRFSTGNSKLLPCSTLLCSLSHDVTLPHRDRGVSCCCPQSLLEVLRGADPAEPGQQPAGHQLRHAKAFGDARLREVIVCHQV